VAHRFLKQILTNKKKSLDGIEAEMDIKRYGCRGFLRNIVNGRVNVIAEIKKASPSRGIINENLDMSRTASVYGSFSGFISGISVLTEELYFRGDRHDIGKARRAASLPILRKDFIFSPKQVYESACLGADCILLIKPLLGFKRLKRLYEYAGSLGLDVLVEVYSKKELLQAVQLGAGLIGINNRDLRNMKADNSHIISVLKDVPPEILKGRTLVCESGVGDISYMETIHAMGVDAFLIGTYFMTSPVLEETLSRLGEGLKERGLA